MELFVEYLEKVFNSNEGEDIEEESNNIISEELLTILPPDSKEEEITMKQ